MFYYGISTKNNEKDLKIANLKPLTENILTECPCNNIVEQFLSAPSAQISLVLHTQHQPARLRLQTFSFLLGSHIGACYYMIDQ